MDLGLQTVNEVFDRLEIEEGWSLREERGFSWWAGVLRQRVWADEPFEDSGMTIVRVHARTDLFKDYNGNSEQASKLGLIMHQSALSGLIHHPDDSTRIQLASSVYVNESTVDWMPGFFLWSVITQIVEAHVWIKAAQDLFKVEADTSEHPVSGVRPDTHETLELVSAVVQPMGLETSKFKGTEMVELVEDIQEPPTVWANGDEVSLSSELPFLGRTSLIRMLTQDQHPRMGHGLLVTLKLPVNIKDPTAEALEMNGRELKELTRAHFLGSWCMSPAGDFCFVSFYPNVMFKTNLLSNVYYSNLGRANWVAEAVYGDDWQNGGFESAFKHRMDMLKGFMDRSQNANKGGLLRRLFKKKDR